MNMIQLLSSLFFCLVFPGLVFSASTDFTIRTQIGTDTDPPTTPVIIDAAPIASTQINVSWTASVDDVIVMGYRIFRDATQIATTTLLTFSDTGLAPSTTYSYTVDAFDSFGNFSSSSVPVATTTLPIVVPPVATTSASTNNNSGSATRTGPKLIKLTVDTTQRSAQFTWQTTNPTQYTLVWGRTTSYELGSVSGILFNRDHMTTIEGLEPGTSYYYELRATDVGGVTKMISADRFTTKNSIDREAVANVNGFTARAQEENVELRWQNSFVEDTSLVRIVRSHLYFPANIQGGAVVYEGRGQSYIDKEALKNRSPQYYTIFVLDTNGGVSSGAVARVFKIETSASTTEVEPIRVTPLPPDVGDDTVLRATDISIIQKETPQTFSGAITLDTALPYLVSIPVGAVPKNLKSIIVSIQNPSDQREVTAYLLKLNQVGDAYITHLPGPGVVGAARIMVELFDYEEATVRRISTQIEFIDNSVTVPFFPNQIINYFTLIVPSILLGLFGWVLLILFKRRRKSKEDKK